MQIKHRLVDFTEATLGNCMLAFPFLKNIRFFGKESLRIAYYHMVSDQSPEYYPHNKIISPKIFKEHLSFFARHFDIISLEDALQLAQSKASLSRKLVFTFDDGFAECHRVIAPILADMKIPATFFLIGNCLDNRDLMWRNKIMVVRNRVGNRIHALMEQAMRIFTLPAISGKEDILDWSFRAWPMNRKDEIADYFWDAAGLEPVDEYAQSRNPYLNYQQVQQLIDAGFEIGAHSMTHPVFSRLTYDEYESEILSSIDVLEKNFERKVISFAYPFGVKAPAEYQSEFIAQPGVHLKTFLGTKNRMANRLNSFEWERDNLAFPMNKMLFRLSVLPFIRRFA